MKKRKLISWVLILCLMVSLLSVTASAATVAMGQNQRWNIVLVVDNSGSLYSHTYTDKYGLRFEALGLLLDSLNDEGDNVGAVVFNAYAGSVASDKNMLMGITVNTGISEIRGNSDKESLLRAIEEAPHTNNPYGDTDIGTALLVAQQQLAEMNNGLPNAIFLFTDGVTDVTYPEPRAKSYENLETAVNNIREQGTMLCGVFLNGNNSTSTEVRDIVADSIGTNSTSLGELYVEINNAADLAAATDAFLTCLGYVSTDTSGYTSTFSKSFRIPGTGVEEANIRLRTANGETLPANMQVTITRPDGTRLTAGEAAAICSAGRTYQIYKLQAPESGTWNVHVELPEHNTVEIVYDPILSVYIDAKMEVTPASQDLHANSDVTVTAYLEQNGSKLNDAASYREYTCMLEMTNVLTGEVTTQEITPDANNNYTVTMNLQNYGVYDVQAAFVCDEIVVSTDKVTWDLQNHAPVSSGTAKYSALYGLFQKNMKTIDLSDPSYGISDIEDGFQSLQFSIQGGTCDLSGAALNGGMLELNAKTCGNGDIVLNITDTQGASTTLTLQVSAESVTLKLLLIILVLVIVAVIIVVWRIRVSNSIRTNGSCFITVWVPRGDNGDGQDITCEGLTPPGGQNSARKLNLYTMLKRDLDNTYGSRIKQECKDSGVEFGAYKRVVEDISAELKKASVECVIFKDKKTKRKSSDRMSFKYKSIQQSFGSGGAVTVMMDGIQVTFGYSLMGKAIKDEPGDDGGWGGIADNDMPAKQDDTDWDSFGGDNSWQSTPSSNTSANSDSFDEDWGTPEPEEKPAKTSNENLDDGFDGFW